MPRSEHTYVKSKRKAHSPDVLEYCRSSLWFLPRSSVARVFLLVLSYGFHPRYGSLDFFARARLGGSSIPKLRAIRFLQDTPCSLMCS